MEWDSGWVDVKEACGYEENKVWENTHFHICTCRQTINGLKNHILTPKLFQRFNNQFTWHFVPYILHIYTPTPYTCITPILTNLISNPLINMESKHLLSILTLLIVVLTSHNIKPISGAATNFIKKSCSTTTYPSLCVKTLGPYASSVGTNPLKLCKVALKVAVQATTNCSATVTKLSKQKGIGRPEALAIKDCIGDLKDAVNELKDTLTAMGNLGHADKDFQWANAKTYASAAITDADTCVDGFLDRKLNAAVKKKIKNCVSGVEKQISNSLALINHLYWDIFYVIIN